MSAAGIITLPGMMTGQILAGRSPFEAARYQIFVLLLLAGATGFGAAAAVMAATWRVTDARHRLCGWTGSSGRAEARIDGLRTRRSAEPDAPRRAYHAARAASRSIAGRGRPIARRVVP